MPSLPSSGGQERGRIWSKGDTPVQIRSAEATLNNAAYSHCRVVYCRPVGRSARLPAKISYAMPGFQITEMETEIQGWRSGDRSLRTREWKPMARRQGLCKLCSKVNQMNCQGKEWRRLRDRKVGISTLCLGLVDKISSGSHRPRRAPCYPLIIADRVISQSLGRGKLETKVSQP